MTTENLFEEFKKRVEANFNDPTERADAAAKISSLFDDYSIEIYDGIEFSESDDDFEGDADEDPDYEG